MLTTATRHRSHMPRTQEIHFHTREQVEGYIDDALSIVAPLQLEDGLRRSAFEKAVDLLAAKQVLVEQPQQVGIDLSKLRV